MKFNLENSTSRNVFLNCKLQIEISSFSFPILWFFTFHISKCYFPIFMLIRAIEHFLSEMFIRKLHFPHFTRKVSNIETSFTVDISFRRLCFTRIRRSRKNVFWHKKDISDRNAKNGAISLGKVLPNEFGTLVFARIIDASLHANEIINVINAVGNSC